ncbi:MAG TPA: NUDIX hydrolase [Balneolaceae bacterium]|nr:NUDIX hydrolase [Balneolaceae bacterium]
MISVTAAGGVIHRQHGHQQEVLLIHRNGLWDLPKGTKEDGESILECARREVAEEVGIPLPDSEGALTETTHTYKRGGKKYRKTTYWFAMQTEMQQGFTPQKEEGIDDVLWAELDEARQKVGYENLKDVLASFGTFIK